MRSLQLSGSREASLALIQASGLAGSEQQQQELCDRYGCNPLALKIVATSIQDLFTGDIATFLAEDVTVFNSIQRLLDQQFNRLSALEQTIMYWLAINREWTTISELADDIFPIVSKANLLEALESLSWRSLIEKQAGNYTQQPVVMEYVTERLIVQVAEEITTKSLHLCRSHALSKAQAIDYLRNSQIQLILHPIADQLLAIYSKPQGVARQITEILASLRQETSCQPGYVAGNLLNLLCHLNIDLTGFDFSNLAVWQAYLQGTPLPQVNFSHSDLSKSLFAYTFALVWGVAFSPDGQVLATGNWDRQVYLWDVASGNQLLVCSGHQDKVWSVAFHPQGHLLASGSDDQTIKLWDAFTGRCLRTCIGHTSCVRSLAFSPTGEWIFSGSADRTIRQWDVNTGQCLQVFQAQAIQTLQRHTAQVSTVQFSPDSRVLASGGKDQNVLLWDVKTAQVLKNLPARSFVWSVAFSPDGVNLAVGAFDSVIRLWNLATERCCQTFSGHTDCVYAVAIDPTGRILASGSHDQTARLWDIRTGTCLHLLEGHSGWILSVAFSPDGLTLASASSDCAIKVWDVRTGTCLLTLEEHKNWVMSVAFSPHGHALASGSTDGAIKLWDSETGSCQSTWRVEGFYQGMNITGVTGLAEAQKATLKALGAVEQLS